MSRCFPFPPPGYVRNGIRDEALIESIKRDTEKVRKERKEEKRKKREKEKAREEGEISEKKHRHKRKHRGETSQEGDGAIRDQHKKQKVDVKDTERSNLTEKHGHPVSSQNSTDSTLHSCMGPETPPSLAMDGRQRSGSIIRIHLPLERQKDPDAIPSKVQPPAFVPGRAMNNAPSTSQMGGTVHRTTLDRTPLEKPCSTSSLKGQESAAAGKKIMDASKMSGTVNRNIEDKARAERPSSSSSSRKFRESSAPGRITNGASLAGSEMRGTVPRTSSPGVCTTSSSLNGRDSSPGGAKFKASPVAKFNASPVSKFNASPVPKSNASPVASQNGVTLPQNGFARNYSSSSVKGKESSVPGKQPSNVSMATSELGKNVIQSNGIRKGHEKPSLPVKSTTNGTPAARQVSGAVPRSSEDRTRIAPGTCEDKTGQEQPSIPMRTIKKASPSAPQICQNADNKTGKVGYKAEEECKASQATRDELGRVKEETAPQFSFGAVAETPAQRPEASPNSQTARRPSSSELKYAKLVENWVPPTLLNLCDEDDQEWLFDRKLNNNKHGDTEASEATDTCLTHNHDHGGNQWPWPRVCFLPDVDMYALPYTIPY